MVEFRHQTGGIVASEVRRELDSLGIHMDAAGGLRGKLKLSSRLHSRGEWSTEDHGFWVQKNGVVSIFVNFGDIVDYEFDEIERVLRSRSFELVGGPVYEPLA